MEKEIDYLNEVTNKIDEAKLLSKIPLEKRSLAIKFLKKKQIIKNKNGLFAQIQINHINKKLNKMCKKNGFYNIDWGA